MDLFGTLLLRGTALHDTVQQESWFIVARSAMCFEKNTFGDALHKFEDV